MPSYPGGLIRKLRVAGAEYVQESAPRQIPGMSMYSARVFMPDGSIAPVYSRTESGPFVFHYPGQGA